ncbi:MAG: glycosyltransferase family 39 protein [Candidatus Omnitrophica bacterium]|nr:glycosyltransferase family 39 protein [Candidatus Omnitrophota bacterium]
MAEMKKFDATAQSSAKTSKTTIIFPFVLSSLMLFHGQALISKGPYHVDCLGLAIAAEKSLASHQLHFMHGHGYPLISILGIIFFGIAKLLSVTDPVIAVNFMNVFFSSISLIPFFFFLKNLFDDKTAILSSLLLCVNPLFLSTSIYGNSHSPFLFFLFSALWLLTVYFKACSAKPLFLAAFFFGLAGAARIQDMAVMVPSIGFLSFILARRPPPARAQEQRLGFLKPFMSATLIGLATVTVFYLLVFTRKDMNSFDKSFFQYRLLDPFSGLISEYLKISFGYLIADFSSWSLLPIIGGLAVLAFEHRGKFGFLLLWFLVPFLAFGNSFFITPRFLLTGFVALIISQGYLFSKLIWNRPKALDIAGKIMFLLLIVLSYHRIYPTLSFRHRHDLIPEYGRWIARVTEPNAKIIVGDEGAFIRRYGRRETIHQIVTDTTYYQKHESLKEELREYKKNLDALLDQGTPVYITEIGLLSNNVGLFYFFLTKYYTLTYKGTAPFEVWHRRCLNHLVIKIKLYQITKKPS